MTPDVRPRLFGIPARIWYFSLFTALALLPALKLRAADTPRDYFTIIALPDTQYYSEGFAETFAAQVEWIRDSRDRLNIAFVAHLGDMVQNDVEAEWLVADRCMSLLGNMIPFCPTVGNHDMAGGREAFLKGIRDTKRYNEHFPPSRFEVRPWYGGHYGDANDNSYYMFSAMGADYLVLSLEYGPRKDVVAWAGEVVKSHPGHKVILVTHFFLDAQGQRMGDKSQGSPAAVFPDATSAEGMWDKLIYPNPNVFMVLCGHISASRRLVSLAKDGHAVIQLLADYQGMENGGNGYLRIMKFFPEKGAIEVTSYSPTLDSWLTDPENQFEVLWESGVAVEAAVSE